MRSTVGHDIGAKPFTNEQPASTPLHEQTHTADASSALSTAKEPVTMSDAGLAGGNPPPHQEVVAASEIETSKADANSEPAKSEAGSSDLNHDGTASSLDKPAEADVEINADKKLEAKAAAPGADEAIKTEQTREESSAAESAKAAEAKPYETKSSEANPETKAEVKLETPKTETAKASEKPGQSTGTVAPSVSASVSDVKTPDAKKDQTRMPDVDKPLAKPAAAKPAPKRTGQIAVFISRKDSKLYVRQNFAPLFDVPVSIAPSDRPLGTHVFTAEVDKEDANVLHWSVVSLPASRRAEAHEERSSRKRKAVAVVEPKPMPAPYSPTEALDRLSIPADVMTRISEALSTGGSIIVSDQGIGAGETGEGTDFILSLR